jgi:tripeptide aminopeptidase
VARTIGVGTSIGESSSDANIPLSLKIPAITIGGGGRSWHSHALDESFDVTDAWKATENAVLLAVSLAR